MAIVTGRLLGALCAAAAALAALNPEAWAERGKAESSAEGAVPLAWRPPGARQGDGGPSPVVFPPESVPLNFNHRLHVEKEGLTCTECHPGAVRSRKASDKLLPPGTACDRCHDTSHEDLSRVTSKVGVDACALCHQGYVPALDGEAQRVAPVHVPVPKLHFSHAAHAERGIGCGHCHGAVEKLGLATRDQLPRMEGCFRCHQSTGPEQGDARGECTLCHLSSAQGGGIQARLSTGDLYPPRWMRGADHGPGWLERHREVAGADPTFCSTCHKEQECLDCHDGRVRPRSVHPNDWISIHALAARQDNPRCGGCHQRQSFCVTCHQRSGVTQGGPGALAAQDRFHPPPQQWVENVRSARHHGWEAQRNLGACVSCHSERDCTTCHSARAPFRPGNGAGGATRPRGMSPHPPDFLRRCGSAFRKNPRACLVCHDGADARLATCR